MKPHPDRLKSVVPAQALAEFAIFPPAHDGDAAIFENPKAQFVSTRVIATLARWAEGLAVLLTGWLVSAFYPGFAHIEANQPYLPLIVALALIFPVIMQISDGYTLRKMLDPGANLMTTLGLWTLLFMGGAATLLLLKAGENYSRIWIASWFVAGGAALIGFRFALSGMARRWNAHGQLNRRAVLVGGGRPASQLASALNSSSRSDITIVGVFDDRGDSRVTGFDDDLRRLGDIGQLIDFVRSTRVDMLLVTLPVTAEARLLQLLKRLWVLPVDIRLSAQGQRLRYRPRAYSYVGSVPFLDVFDKPLGEWGPIVKAIEDKLIAALLLGLLSPLLLLAAIAVKLTSRGPVLFKQKRFGFNNELIEVFKFRSMHRNAADPHAETLTSKRDPRVTSVGRFLRRFSIDELPQLFNVLNGTLSLVGPRPHATRAKAADRLYFDVVDGYFARHKVKPGITGWAQVKGWRGETDTDEKIQKRVEHDLYYIENWSLALDLTILAMTPLAVIKGENAY
jgi:Undecaprenyl-phosphate glucose phosphotransferase